ncbi:alpha-L-fucosidase [Gemmatimonadota bacterium]
MNTCPVDRSYHRFSVMALIGLMLAVPGCGARPAELAPNAVAPSPEQLAYHQMEYIGFIHFTVNTFTDREWGYGNESPGIFDPSQLDPDQWARVAAEAGMKELILTAKHHDGFCLWPSEYTDHSVRNSPWKNGEGDLVGEFVAACRRHALKVGLYLSPWDRNHADYGTPAYLDYYRNQLRELLTRYGEITEIWVDGANGGTGWYGGADEERRIDRSTYYEWDETFALVKSLMPGVLIFSDAGPDIRWIGNERGYAGETCWSMIKADRVTIGASDQAYLNTGDPEGTHWTIPLCDTSIRPGWFYHADQDERVKQLPELLEVWYRSIGRNGVLLLNLPPDQRGLIHDNDIAALNDLRRVLDETFAVDLAAGKSVISDQHRLGHRKFAPGNLTDDNPDSYWAAEDRIRMATLEVELGSKTVFDRIELREPIRFGQRISEFSIDALFDGEWREITRGTTIGYRRILRIFPIATDRVRIRITRANNTPALSHFGLFKASTGEVE